ncbi:hypothetical protein ACFU9B_12860, partial [Streptomyces sp. NPDC057592]|uniref:hypothetical protein n=1 Tax=Streptomyces sp. NPDC057592 TaxID=3346175 RepID=UPI0036900958
MTVLKRPLRCAQSVWVYEARTDESDVLSATVCRTISSESTVGSSAERTDLSKSRGGGVAELVAVVSRAGEISVVASVVMSPKRPRLMSISDSSSVFGVVGVSPKRPRLMSISDSSSVFGVVGVSPKRPRLMS